MNAKASSRVSRRNKLATATALVLGVVALVFFAWPAAPPVSVSSPSPAPVESAPTPVPSIGPATTPAGVPAVSPSVPPPGIAARPPAAPQSSSSVPSYSTGKPNVPGTGALVTGGVPLVPEFKPSSGTVTIGKRTLPVQSTQGRYPRLAVEKLKPVDVTLRFPVDGSKAVLVSVNHGGRINDDKVTETFPLGADRTVRFTFTPSDQSGKFQVGLQRGTYLEAMEFWVPTGDARLDATAF